jgi:hypothetical protein
MATIVGDKIKLSNYAYLLNSDGDGFIESLFDNRDKTDKLIDAIDIDWRPYNLKLFNGTTFVSNITNEGDSLETEDILNYLSYSYSAVSNLTFDKHKDESSGRKYSLIGLGWDNKDKSIIGYVYAPNVGAVYGTFSNYGEVFNDYSNNKATGQYSKASNWTTYAGGKGSSASGISSSAYGDASSANGLGTQVKNQSEFAVGSYNVTQSTYLFEVGNGTSNSARSNALTVDKSGSTYIQNNLYIDGVLVGAGVHSVTYSELTSLKNNSSLKPGQWYRLTDYEFTTTQSNTEAAKNTLFDILILATSENTLSELCRAINKDSSKTFCNKWQIWYTIDNINWSDTTTGKGTITRMIDDHNNDCHYDFKNCLFYRWENNETISAGTYLLYSVSDNGNMKHKFYTFDKNEEDYSLDDNCFNNKIVGLTNSELPNNVLLLINTYIRFININGRKNTCIDCQYIDVDVSNQNIFYQCKFINIGKYSSENTLVGCEYLHIGELFSKNILLGGLYSTFGNSCKSNTILDFNSIKIGNEFLSNNALHFNRNNIGNYCMHNDFGSYFINNNVGNRCHNNTFGNNCAYNTFGNNCIYNKTPNYFCNNKYGDGCISIHWGTSSYNTAQSITSKTTITYAQNNIIDNGCKFLDIYNSGETTSSSKILQNVHIHQGVCGGAFTTTSGSTYNYYSDSDLNSLIYVVNDTYPRLKIDLKPDSGSNLNAWFDIDVRYNRNKELQIITV